MKLKKIITFFITILIFPVYLLGHTPFEDLIFFGQIYFISPLYLIIIFLIILSIYKYLKNRYDETEKLSIIIIILSFSTFIIIPLLVIIIWGSMLVDNIKTFIEYYYPTIIFCCISLAVGLIVLMINKNKKNKI